MFAFIEKRELSVLMPIRQHPQYPVHDESYLEKRSGITPRMVAEHIMDHPYHGRDQKLAEGWLVVIGAIESGEDPLANLQQFVTHIFLHSNNNGVPLEQSGYAQEIASTNP